MFRHLCFSPHRWAFISSKWSCVTLSEARAWTRLPCPNAQAGVTGSTLPRVAGSVLGGPWSPWDACRSDLHWVQHLTQRKTLEQHPGMQNSRACCPSYEIDTAILLTVFQCSTTKYLLEQAPGTALARWLSGKEPACQCRRLRRLGFDPWVGKIPWSRKWQPTPVFLPGESHG